MVLMTVAERQRRLRAKIGLDDAIASPAAQAVAVEIAVLVQIGAYRAGADAAVVGQGSADIGVEAQMIVGTILGAAAHLK